MPIDTPLGWYRWYPRDFAMSSTVRKMSITAKGVYRELLDLQWEDSGVPLTGLEAKSIIHATDDEWAQFEPHFLTCFPNGINQKLAEQREVAVQARIKQSESGKLGGTSAGKGRPKVTKGKLRGTPNQTETETETNKDKEQLFPQAETARFRKPSLDELTTQFRTKGCGDPEWFAEAFMDYFETVDWIVGKKKMVKWKSAVATWIRNAKNRGEWVEAPPVQIVQQLGIDYIAVNGVQMELDGVTPFNVRAWRQKKRIEMGLVSA